METIITILLWCAVVVLVARVGPGRLWEGLSLTAQIAFNVATIPLDAIWGIRREIFWSALGITLASFGFVFLGLSLESGWLVAIGGIFLGVYLLFLTVFANGIAWYLSTLVKVAEGVGTLFRDVLVGLLDLLRLTERSTPQTTTVTQSATIRLIDHDTFRGQVRKIFGFLTIGWLSLACALTIAPYWEIFFKLPVLALFGLTIGFIALQNATPGSIYRKLQGVLGVLMGVYLLGAVLGLVISRDDAILARLPEAIRAPLRYVGAIRDQSTTHIERASLPHETDSALTLIEIAEDTTLYILQQEKTGVFSFQPDQELKLGTRVASEDPKPKQRVAGYEPVIEVVLPDKRGEFVTSRKTGFVIARKVRILSPLPQSSQTSFWTDGVWLAICAIVAILLIATIVWLATSKSRVEATGQASSPATAGATKTAGSTGTTNVVGGIFGGLGKGVLALLWLALVGIIFLYIWSSSGSVGYSILPAMLLATAIALGIIGVTKDWRALLACPVVAMLFWGYMNNPAGATVTRQPTQTTPDPFTGQLTIPANMYAFLSEAATLYALPVNQLSAICLRESGCNPSIQDGAAGEIGPMQIWPPTGRSVCGMTEDALRNTRNNVMCGGQVYKACSVAFGHRVDGLQKTILCYNNRKAADFYADTPWNQIPKSALMKKGRYNSYDYVLDVLAILQSGGGVFAQAPLPQPSTPAPVVRITDTVADITLHGFQVIPFKLPAGTWRVSQNAGPLPWTLDSKIYEPGEHNCGQLYDKYEVAPNGCSADTVIEYTDAAGKKVKRVVYLGDVISLDQPTAITVLANGWEKERRKFPVDRKFARQIILEKEDNGA